MRNLENTCGFYQRTYQRPHEDNDPNKPQLYWDGYQWVIRPSNGSLVQEQIKPDRKVQIANVPLHLNLQVKLFKEYIIKNMIEKNVISTSETKNIQSTIRTIEFYKENNTVVLSMESIELAKQMILIDGIVLLGHTLRVSPYKSNNGEMSLSNINKEAALANSAQLSAKSAAISFAAFQSILKKKDETNFNYSTGDGKLIIPSSRVVKIMNAIDQNNKEDSAFNEVLEDMREELQKYGKILSAFIVKKGKEILGAEIGAVFIEYENTRDAEQCVIQMKGRLYEQREIKFAFFDEGAFLNEIQPNF